MLNRANRATVTPVVVVLRVHVRTIEVQVVGVRGRVVGTRPIVAVRAAIVERRTIVVAGRGHENVPQIVSRHLSRLWERINP